MNHSFVSYVNQNNILHGLDAKQPKTVSGCVYAMKEVIR